MTHFSVKTNYKQTLFNCFNISHSFTLQHLIKLTTIYVSSIGMYCVAIPSKYVTFDLPTLHPQ